MGVTNRSKITYKPSVASSTAGSSQESLHLPPDAGNYSEEPEQLVSFRNAINLLTHNVTRVTSIGRRRANRLKSLRDLENLRTISEEDEGDTVATYAFNQNRPFLKIINDDRLSKVWANFYSCAEKEEEDMMLKKNKVTSHVNKTNSTKSKRNTYFKTENGYNIRLAVDAYRSLAYPTRRRLRKVKNLQPLFLVEQNIVDNFYINRKQIIENVDFDKNIQFICYAACEYYNLDFKLIHSENGNVSCTIDGLTKCYTHCPEMLSKFLKERRSR